jgi:two-component system sensor histidine kinase KdpD
VTGQSGSIDVHMVTHPEAGGGLRAQLARSPLAPSRKVIGWLLAFLLPGAVTGGGLILHQVLDISTNAAGFVLATVAVALVGGLGPALLSALLGAILLNFFFVPPTYTLTIARPENLITLITMLVVAVLVALVVDRAARRAGQAAQARTEAALLASYARTVLTNPMPLVRLLEKVQENFNLTSVALLERDGTEWRRVACVGGQPCDEPDEADVDVPVTPDVHLALRGRALPAADRQVLEAAAGQALLALRQQRMAAKAAAAQRRAETTELRTALLSAVGHDLRTPLTSIKAAVSSLRDPELALSEEDTSELLATVEESADRLTGLVDNLLDSSRLAAGAVEPTMRPVGYYEAVARALSGIDERKLVEVDVDEHLPLVLADAGLLERVIANVIDNALRYGRDRRSNGGPQVAVRASSYRGQVELRVVDHGPGLPKRASETVFAPFQRLGDRHATVGVGLGLSVAKGFTEAMGGTIRTEDTPSGGLTVVIALPAAAGPDSPPSNPAPMIQTMPGVNR